MIMGLCFLEVSLRLILTITLLDLIELSTNNGRQQHISRTVFNSTLTQLSNDAISSAFFKGDKQAPSAQSLSLINCPTTPNPITNAIRLPNEIHSISLTFPGQETDNEHQYFNPTLIPLPPYSPYPYLLLSRLVTAGLHQESHICMATFCLPPNSTAPKILPADVQHCDDSGEGVLGTVGGIRCASAPERLNIPPTPAGICEGAWSAFPDIPGFHDPRMFWSGKGEPLVIVNSGSRHGCVGLWIVDIRAVYPELDDLLARRGRYTRTNLTGKGTAANIPAPMSYPHLTELTKNPRSSRSAVEKNWILFFPQPEQAWIQYDLVTHGRRVQDEEQRAEMPLHDANLVELLNHDDGSGSTAEDVLATPATNFDTEDTISSISSHDDSTSTMADSQSHDYSDHIRRSDMDRAKLMPVLAPARTIAKLIGSGYTTPNLTAPNEAPCLTSADLLDNTGRPGHWHQGSNSLQVILCSRHDLACLSNHSKDQLVSDGKVAHFAVLHRKFSNEMDLPMRYERYFMVWEARPPFRMVGISRHPILFSGEKANPWTELDNGINDGVKAKRRTNAYFTYTPSIAWAWRRDAMVDDAGRASMLYGVGYLDDEVVVGIGMDDTAQGVVRVKADELLSCLRLCPDFEDFDQQ